MASHCVLPAGTYFVGDAAHLYLSCPDKPPMLDEATESNHACVDWMLHDVAYEHLHAARHMVGVTTGQHDQVTSLLSGPRHALWQKRFIELPNCTLYVVPTSILPVQRVEELDPAGVNGMFVTFEHEVQVLVCVEDWVESRGYVRLEDEANSVVVEWGSATSAPLMLPRAQHTSCMPNEAYAHISQQDLHALFVHLSLMQHTCSSGSSNCKWMGSGGALPPRLDAHFRLFKRNASLDTDDVSGAFHDVCKELASRGLKQAADAQRAHTTRLRLHEERQEKKRRKLL